MAVCALASHDHMVIMCLACGWGDSRIKPKQARTVGDTGHHHNERASVLSDVWIPIHIPSTSIWDVSHVGARINLKQ